MIVDYLIVAGGGGGSAGGASGGDSGGGGGGGGVLSGSTTLAIGDHTITVGGSGAVATNGGNSSISGGVGTSTGGGAGGAFNANGAAGGSGGGGGGGAGPRTGGAGTGGQGFAGGNGNASSNRAGGGGGATAVGVAADASNGGNGGAGLTSSISGTAVVYGSGAGGGGGTGGAGGSGGGTGGNSGTGAVATAGTVNRGGGGGGGTNQGGAAVAAAAGGSGVVIIRYVGGVAATGGTVTESGGFTIHTFTGGGTFTVVDSITATMAMAFTASATMGVSTGLAMTANVVFTARGHLERTDWLEPTPYISVDGVQRGTDRPVSTAFVLNDDVNVVQDMDHVANHCSFVAVGFEPLFGQRVIVVLGSIDNPDRVFAGSVISVTQLQRNESGLKRYGVSCIDDTWKLTFPRVVGKMYVGESATDIVLDLVDTYADWLDTSGVEAGLDSLDEISFENGTTLDSAFTQLAKRIGAYWDVTDDGGLRFGHELDPIQPAWLTPLAFEGVAPDALAVQRDGSQVVTRVLFECGGAPSLAEIAVGQTAIPVLTGHWYRPGEVVSGKNRLTFASVDLGGGGSLVGVGIGPAVAPTITSSSTPGSVNAGTHQYAQTFTTGAGESLPSPIATTTGTLPAPTDKPVFAHNGPNANQTTRVINRTIQYKYTYSTAAGAGDTSAETTASPASVGILTTVSTSNPAKSSSIGVNIANPASALVTWIRVYTSINGGLFYFTEAVVPSGTSGYTLYTDLNGDITSGAEPPAANTATVTRFTIGLAISGSVSVTGRKLYRTVANGSQLKLLATVADNTTTTFDDGVADASLGANAPTADTSGLSQTTGQVNAGATTIPVAGASWANASGGWAIVGNGDQVIRYTGVTGNTLTGVTGLTASIAFNSSITAAPMLTGIPASGPGSVTTIIPRGQEVNMLVTVDSTVGQAALADALEPPGAIGVVEEYVQERRLGVEEATARCHAILALRELPETSLRYQTRDRHTKAGRTVTAMLPAPTSVEGQFRLQRVTISGFSPSLHPLRQVEASNSRFSFEDLLRGARQANRAQSV